MKVEREFQRSDARSKSKIACERWFYGPTYIRDAERPNGTGEPILFVHRYRLYVTPKGNLSVRRFLDVEQYPDDMAMAIAIEERGLELPEDQPPDDWMPDEIAEQVAAYERAKAALIS